MPFRQLSSKDTKKNSKFISPWRCLNCSFYFLFLPAAVSKRANMKLMSCPYITRNNNLVVVKKFGYLQYVPQLKPQERDRKWEWIWSQVCPTPYRWRSETEKIPLYFFSFFFLMIKYKSLGIWRESKNPSCLNREGRNIKAYWTYSPYADNTDHEKLRWKGKHTERYLQRNEEPSP